MALTHLVRVHLRPGVQSISVQYQVADSGIWVTWSEGDRIIQGATVRFTVTTYPNFVLTEWKAYYADEYDDTVNLSLTGVQGQSAWEFTMPPAGPVEIRCEAESRVPPEEVWGSILTQPLEVMDILDVDTFLGYMYPSTVPEPTDPTVIPYRLVISPGVPMTNFISLYNRFMADAKTGYIRIDDSGLYMTFCHYPSTDPDVSVPYIADVNDSQYARRYYYEQHYVSCERSIDNNTRTVTVTGLSTGATLERSYWVNNLMFLNGGLLRTATNHFYFSINKARSIATSGHEAAIRYIFNPEGSGEVEPNSPTEFEQGTTEFTFEWRIKVGYSLRRITSFAVGTGTLEDDVSYSSVYDGETRTYTVTVQEIPNWAIGARIVIECTNHNDPNVGGNSSPGGGNGTFDETSDHVPVEPMPSISAADAGMITLFRPSLAELKQLGAYLWTNIEDFIDNLKKMFSNPMDTIIALNILPGLPPVGTARNIRLGIWETDVSMSPVLSQWYELNFGTVSISEFWGSALDYSPNTKISAMLPFIGSVQLDTDDVMGREVGLLYRIDLLSGHLVAQITVNDDVLYQFTGECAVAVPLTGADWSRVYGAIAGTLGAAAVGVAGAAAAGASAGVASNVARMGALRTAVSAGKEFRRSGIDAKGVAGVRTMRQQMLDTAQQALDASADIARGSGDASVALKAGVAAHAANNVVGQIMSGKVSVAHSGTISGSAGLLGVRRPYIYIEYPNQSLPDGYKHFYGYPSNMRATLGELSGFTQCYQVLINGFTGTDGEFGELLEALKEGVYL